MRTIIKESTGEKPTNISVIRCDIMLEACPGVACFMAFNKRTSHFKDYDKNTEMIAYFTYGGCSGRRVYRLVKSLKKFGVDVVPEFLHANEGVS